MSLNIEVGTNIKCTDGIAAYYLYEGDKVICHTGEKVYNGIISFIGSYKENPDSELQQVICIDTWKSRVSMSRDMINVKDITYIDKNPFYDNQRPFGNEQDYMDRFIKNGYSNEQAKAICAKISDTLLFYNIPFMNAMIYAIEAAEQVNLSDKKDTESIINHFAKQCVEEAQKEYFELVEIYQKVIEQCDRDAGCVSDTLGIVSKCWNDLEKQKTDRAVNTL